MKNKTSAPMKCLQPVWPRADPAALRAFDSTTRICTMNCGPARGDPRREAERRLLCADCIPLYLCHRCGAASYNPNDIRESYCAACHLWAS